MERAAVVAFVPTGKLASDLALSVDWTKYLLDLIPTDLVASIAAQRVLSMLIFVAPRSVSPAPMREEALRLHHESKTA